MADKHPRAPYLYSLMIEVDPERGGPYLKWLLDKHIREVRRCPGFLWARRAMFEQKAADGWLMLNVSYGLRSREDFLKYRESAALKRFMEEAKRFEGTFRITRRFGRVDLALD